MMKTNTTNKKAYQAPVIRSVEFNVEKGFAGSPSLVPHTNMTEAVMQNNVNYTGSGDNSHFTYSF